MNFNIDNNTPDKLQESYRLMLMTLEYGGSINTKALEEIEKILKDNDINMASVLNN